MRIVAYSVYNRKSFSAVVYPRCEARRRQRVRYFVPYILRQRQCFNGFNGKMYSERNISRQRFFRSIRSFGGRRIDYRN